MEVRELKTLLALMQDFGLVELEIEDQEGQGAPGAGEWAAMGAPRGARASKRAEHGRVGGVLGRAEICGDCGKWRPRREPPELAENQKLIASPMVGTFYRASSPDSNPFVEEGDSVRKGQTLCIIEAMKMMNEIDADAGGRVVRILCENGQPIEYGQPLMILELG